MENTVPAHLLIVDDESSIRLSLTTFLEDAGYRVSAAKNGEQALTMVDDTPFDAIVLDLSMPGMSGLDVMRAIDVKRRSIPVIVCSGTGAFKDAVEALRLGAWDFLSKPIPDLTLLQHALERSLERAMFLREKDKMLAILETKVKERTAELEAANSSLEQKNLALKEILFVSRSETERLRQDLSSNVERLLRPKIDELRKGLPTSKQSQVDDIIEAVGQLGSPVVRGVSRLATTLSPSEIRICELIRQGLPNKEIAQRAHISVDTVGSHRRNIRRKLGIQNQGTSLNSYLESLNQEEFGGVS